MQSDEKLEQIEIQKFIHDEKQQQLNEMKDLSLESQQEQIVKQKKEIALLKD